MEKVNFAQKFAQIHEYWKPYIAGELNGQLWARARCSAGSGLVAGELFSSDVVIIDAGILEDRPQGLHHSGWAGDVINGGRYACQILSQQLLVDNAPFAVPREARLLHLSHDWDESEV